MVSNMNIKFNGNISEVMDGIVLLADDLDVTLSDSGYEIEVTQKDGSPLTVSMENGKGSIIYDKKCHFFRAFGIAVEHLRAGEKSFSVTEIPQFNMNGPMFDVSQGNAAFNVKTLKGVIRNLAVMGLNMLMLYCEDSFEVKEQPFFGYMRARYSEDEMRELDAYADTLGIEMIPCIQTLAHLSDTLRWKNLKDITDYPDCLLVGEEKTYEFIEDLIRAASRPFKTKKIHIGMDEAWKLGRGNYLTKNGYKEPSLIMAEHLARVNEIVKKLGLEPMMWDDMFFRTYGTRGYYQPDTPIPQVVIDSVPDNMSLIYWDYYRLTEEKYAAMIPRHLELTDKLKFAGGIWTWHGFGLQWTKTRISTDAALAACKKAGIKDIIATVWGDNGTECLMNTTLIGCQLFAEHGYAETIDYDKFRRRFEFCTGGKLSDFENLERLDRTPDTVDAPDPSNFNSAKYLMWQDILTGLCDKNIEGVELDAHYARLAEDLKPAIGRNGNFNAMFEFNYHVANVLAKKSQMGLRLTAAYKAGDKNALKAFATEELPDLKERVIALRKVHMENWFSLYKAFGWDIMDMRYGSLITRINSAIEEIEAYLSGKLERLEELEEERRYFNDKPGPLHHFNAYGRMASPSRIAPEA